MFTKWIESFFVFFYMKKSFFKGVIREEVLGITESLENQSGCFTEVGEFLHGQQKHVCRPEHFSVS